MASFRRALGLAPLLALCGCGAGSSDAGNRGRAAAGDALEPEILVSAAASLTDAFEAIAAAFEAAHPGTQVLLNLAGSSSLRAQILEGAPADVFASANRGNMHRVAEAGALSGEARVFARNRLEIAVPAGNPAGVHGLEDFADPTLRLGLCAESVPCGDFARKALRKAGVTPSLDTNEPNVRALLTKVELGELDAGITYVTDVASARGSVDGIPLPDTVEVAASYPIAVLARAPHPRGARAFVAFVLSAEGREILARHGFAAP